jgi:hypothetical protein
MARSALVGKQTHGIVLHTRVFTALRSGDKKTPGLRIFE